MAQVINTNSLSLITQNNINKNQSALSSSIERLSSGLRINSAKDDAAGQAISNRFTSNIKGLTQAARNANDGISLAQTTEGALSEINNNLQRIRELTVQSQTGTNSESDLSSIQKEISSRMEEINRVSEQTQFNGVNVLAKDGTMKIQVGANDGQTISIDLKQINSETLKLTSFDITKSATSVPAGATTKVTNAITDTKGGSLTNLKVVTDGTDKFVTDGTNFYATSDNPDATDNDFKFDSSAALTGAAIPTGTLTDVELTKDVALDASGLAAGKSLVQYKDTSGNTAYAIQTKNATTGAITFKNATIAADGTVNEGTTDVALTADPLKKLDDAIALVDDFRSSLGAVQNRLSSAVTNLNNTTTNLSEAQSRIQDADYATEVSNMSKAQIIQQAGNSVLSKANQVPQQVLSLLQG
ncbi:flagellin [Enterobacter hormaechei]|uniref:FliC/FljB family flagellin n=1 Tax=Enterobacter hormaechei TaxID=158836 RepID=UPI0005EDC40A|nr:FliC/FljB family flagellin [Enterobacter hormaechei]ELX7455125.1 FliC/FljB family flagellin [Enterobacter hormaechei subsp. hoffmannii]EHN8717908.1 FliC/FljB family flagellin [Enterobacter hormaechei]EJV4647420.1 FliC/FljB family flagellin [Enterobacter hormaechei]ELC6308905.1 FliC/FljB family flagellin [Enterobacter hormaechei]ELD4165954.1 FliC/FljB family flagellin [Enterobacter hormaechei]